jgi:hypothetical protein
MSLGDKTADLIGRLFDAMLSPIFLLILKMTESQVLNLKISFFLKKRKQKLESDKKSIRIKKNANKSY